MKNFLFLLTLLLSFSACESEQEKLIASIGTLESEVDTSANAENTKALVEQYEGYVATYPDDVENSASYLYRAAGLQYRMNRFSAAVSLLNQSLKNYWGSSVAENSALMLGSIYKEKLRNEVGASGVYQCFMQAFPNSEKTASIKNDYGSLPPLGERILDFGSRLMNDSTHRIDYRVANDFIGLCEIHALMLPDHAKTPEFLHKGGETARSLRSFPKALELYEWIYTKYPEHEKAAQALFLTGFTYDNDLKEYDKARKIYEDFLAKYPNDDFADDTKFLLENLGKSDEEIIQSFEGGEEKKEQ